MKKVNITNIGEMEDLLTCLKNHNKEFEKIEKKDVSVNEIKDVIKTMADYYKESFNTGKKNSARLYGQYYQMARSKLKEIDESEASKYPKTLEELAK